MTKFESYTEFKGENFFETQCTFAVSLHCTVHKQATAKPNEN